MFWCDWGHPPRIEVAHMTGKQRNTLVIRDLVRPHALALDLPQRRLYWIDSRLLRLESVDYYGNRR